MVPLEEIGDILTSVPNSALVNSGDLGFCTNHDEESDAYQSNSLQFSKSTIQQLNSISSIVDQMILTQGGQGGVAVKTTRTPWDRKACHHTQVVSTNTKGMDTLDEKGGCDKACNPSQKYGACDVEAYAFNVYGYD